MQFFAHSKHNNDGRPVPKGEWEPLFTPFGGDPQTQCQGGKGSFCPKCEELDPRHGHLNKVAHLASQFAEKLDLGLHGFTAGLLHDFGKYSKQFQDYISPDSLISMGGDHSTAGASFTRTQLHKTDPTSSYLMSICIACHHTGLIDLLCPNGKNGYTSRFTDEKSLTVPIKQFIKELQFPNSSEFKPEIEHLKSNLKRNAGTPFEMGLVTKFFFSCLIDADRTATIAFIEGKTEPPTRNWKELLRRFHLKCQTEHKFDTELNITRSQISDHCFKQAESKPQGIYKLSLPTGSGKTLTSLRYALKHAELHKLEQIIFVVPYTTILEQNAQEARDYLEDNDFVVLEHHSNLSNETRELKKTEDFDPYEKFSENWDAPVIFTTMVQFMNALYQDGTKSVRRLHRLSKSIIVFDEIQTLPLKLTHLFNRAANFLSEYGKSTLVLCTATQPSIDQLPTDSTESLRLADYPNLITAEDYPAKVFDRYVMKNLGKIHLSELAQQLISSAVSDDHVLVVLNTKDSAKTLFQLVNNHIADQTKDIKIIFLSTDLCPLHRKERIEELTKCSSWDSKQKIICISTNLIEAGVDLDFSHVYRASCPLDSLIQSAGRCNRHNKRKKQGEVFHFELIEETLSTHLKQIATGASITRSLLRDFTDKPIKLTDRNKDDYFRQLYKTVANQITHNPLSYPVRIPATKTDDTLMSLLGTNTHSKKNSSHLPQKGFCQSFKTAGQLFEVIPSGTFSLLVPYKEGKSLIKTIRNTSAWELKWSIVREAQAYTISIYRYQFEALEKLDAIETLSEEKKIYALHESNYDTQNHTGLAPKKVFLTV